MTASSSMKAVIEQITCPDCGLALRVDPTASGTTFAFDMNEWQPRCKMPELGAPAWCLIRRDGTCAIRKPSRTGNLRAL